MPENGLLDTAGVSKRSAMGITAMLLLAKLSDSDGDCVPHGMICITVIAVFYFIFNEIKDRRCK
jgi:hypothetical protein